MDKDKRITTIVLDKEADRQAKIIAEFTSKSLSAVYRDALDVYFQSFVDNDLFAEINQYLIKLGFEYGIDAPHVFDAIRERRLADAALMIGEAMRRLPPGPETQKLVEKGMWLISIMSK